jgi:hypothetical protein
LCKGGRKDKNVSDDVVVFVSRTPVGHAVAHPLAPRLREALLPAVVRLAVHVLHRRRLARVHAAHRRFPMRRAAEPPVAQVAPVDEGWHSRVSDWLLAVITLAVITLAVIKWLIQWFCFAK